MDDSALYTGVDGDEGIFGNEAVDETVKKKLEEQDTLLKQLRPDLEKIIDMLEAERAGVVQDIANFIDKSTEGKDIDVAEIKAAARYRSYIDTLKTKFTLALNEAKK